jgi:RNA-directed DNA polymerase
MTIGNKRKEGQTKKMWAKGSKLELIAKNQDWKCPICKDYLSNGERIETHHKVPRVKGGSDDPENLVHLHRACHKAVHSSKSKFESLK